MNLWSSHNILALSDAFPFWASIKCWSQNLFLIFSLMNIYIWSRHLFVSIQLWHNQEDVKAAIVCLYLLSLLPRPSFFTPLLQHPQTINKNLRWLHWASVTESYIFRLCHGPQKMGFFSNRKGIYADFLSSHGVMNILNYWYQLFYFSSYSLYFFYHCRRVAS